MATPAYFSFFLTWGVRLWPFVMSTVIVTALPHRPVIVIMLLLFALGSGLCLLLMRWQLAYDEDESVPDTLLKFLWWDFQEACRSLGSALKLMGTWRPRRRGLP